MTTLIDYTTAVKEQLEKLTPIGGYCLMIDICGSTALKQQGHSQWILDFILTFGFVLKEIGFPPLKIVGDMMMFWIPDDPMRPHCPLEFFDLLTVMQDEKRFRPMRMAMARCEKIYEICFLKASEDVYGQDIDLTARLLSFAKPGEILIEERLHEILRREHSMLPPNNFYDCFRRLEGPWTQEIKGIPHCVKLYKYRSRMPGLDR